MVVLECVLVDFIILKIVSHGDIGLNVFAFFMCFVLGDPGNPEIYSLI